MAPDNYAHINNTGINREVGHCLPKADPIVRREVKRLAGLHVEGLIPGVDVADGVGPVFRWGMPVRYDHLPQQLFPGFIPPALGEAQEKLLVTRQTLAQGRGFASEGESIGVVGDR